MRRSTRRDWRGSTCAQCTAGCTGWRRFGIAGGSGRTKAAAPGGGPGAAVRGRRGRAGTIVPRAMLDVRTAAVTSRYSRGRAQCRKNASAALLRQERAPCRGCYRPHTWKVRGGGVSSWREGRCVEERSTRARPPQACSTPHTAAMSLPPGQARPALVRAIAASMRSRVRSVSGAGMRLGSGR